MAIALDLELTTDDREALHAFLLLMKTDSPRLEQIWACMDLIWDVQGCDNQNPVAEQLDAYYRHPVWLLNGLFIEQHDDSLRYRDIISDWVVEQSPSRVADIGGGFGTLARAIAGKAPQVCVEVIEPHAHQCALARSAAYPGMSYQTQCSGQYDLMIATDVFEHVEDPLAVVERTAAHLAPGGQYLMANCFQPVIKCHLPCTFHFRDTWPWMMRKMNLKLVGKVAYGAVFEKCGPVQAKAARGRERLSRMSHDMAIGNTPALRKLRNLVVHSARALSSGATGKR